MEVAVRRDGDSGLWVGLNDDTYVQAVVRRQPRQRLQPAFHKVVCQRLRVGQNALELLRERVLELDAPENGVHVLLAQLGSDQEPHAAATRDQAGYPLRGHGQRCGGEEPGDAGVRNRSLQRRYVERIQRVVRGGI